MDEPAAKESRPKRIIRIDPSKLNCSVQSSLKKALAKLKVPVKRETSKNVAPVVVPVQNRVPVIRSTASRDTAISSSTTTDTVDYQSLAVTTSQSVHVEAESPKLSRALLQNEQEPIGSPKTSPRVLDPVKSLIFDRLQRNIQMRQAKKEQEETKPMEVEVSTPVEDAKSTPVAPSPPLETTSTDVKVEILPANSSYEFQVLPEPVVVPLDVILNSDPDFAIIWPMEEAPPNELNHSPSGSLPSPGTSKINVLENVEAKDIDLENLRVSAVNVSIITSDGPSKDVISPGGGRIRDLSRAQEEESQDFVGFDVEEGKQIDGPTEKEKYKSFIQAIDKKRELELERSVEVATESRGEEIILSPVKKRERNDSEINSPTKNDLKDQPGTSTKIVKQTLKKIIFGGRKSIEWERVSVVKDQPEIVREEGTTQQVEEFKVSEEKNKDSPEVDETIVEMETSHKSTSNVTNETVLSSPENPPPSEKEEEKTEVPVATELKNDPSPKKPAIPVTARKPKFKPNIVKRPIANPITRIRPSLMSVGESTKAVSTPKIISASSSSSSPQKKEQEAASESGFSLPESENATASVLNDHLQEASNSNNSRKTTDEPTDTNLPKSIETPIKLSKSVEKLIPLNNTVKRNLTKETTKEPVISPTKSTPSDSDSKADVSVEVQPERKETGSSDGSPMKKETRKRKSILEVLKSSASFKKLYDQISEDGTSELDMEDNNNQTDEEDDEGESITIPKKLFNRLFSNEKLVEDLLKDQLKMNKVDSKLKESEEVEEAVRGSEVDEEKMDEEVIKPTKDSEKEVEEEVPRKAGESNCSKQNEGKSKEPCKENFKHPIEDLMESVQEEDILETVEEIIEPIPPKPQEIVKERGEEKSLKGSPENDLPKENTVEIEPLIPTKTSPVVVSIMSDWDDQPEVSKNTTENLETESTKYSKKTLTETETETIPIIFFNPVVRIEKLPVPFRNVTRSQRIATESELSSDQGSGNSSQEHLETPTTKESRKGDRKQEWNIVKSQTKPIVKKSESIVNEKEDDRREKLILTLQRPATRRSTVTASAATELKESPRNKRRKVDELPTNKTKEIELEANWTKSPSKAVDKSLTGGRRESLKTSDSENAGTISNLRTENLIQPEAVKEQENSLRATRSLREAKKSESTDSEKEKKCDISALVTSERSTRRTRKLEVAEENVVLKKFNISTVKPPELSENPKEGSKSTIRTLRGDKTASIVSNDLKSLKIPETDNSSKPISPVIVLGRKRKIIPSLNDTDSGSHDYNEKSSQESKKILLKISLSTASDQSKSSPKKIKDDEISNETASKPSKDQHESQVSITTVIPVRSLRRERKLSIKLIESQETETLSTKRRTRPNNNNNSVTPIPNEKLSSPEKIVLKKESDEIPAPTNEISTPSSPISNLRKKSVANNNVGSSMRNEKLNLEKNTELHKEAQEMSVPTKTISAPSTSVSNLRKKSIVTEKSSPGKVISTPFTTPISNLRKKSVTTPVVPVTPSKEEPTTSSPPVQKLTPPSASTTQSRISQFFTPTTKNTDTVKATDHTCGNCKEFVPIKQWRKHLHKHNGLAWIEGVEPAINLFSYTDMTRVMTNFMVKNRLNSLQCEKCGETRKSGLGLVSHAQTCGMSEAEIEASKVACQYCQKRMLFVSMSIHLKTCPELLRQQAAQVESVEEPVKEVEETFETSGRGRRLKAPKKTEIDLRDMYTRKTFTNKVSNRWKNDSNRNLQLMCFSNACKFRTTDYEEMMVHHKSCQKVKLNIYGCKLCREERQTKADMETHLKTHYRAKKDEESDNEPYEDASDASVGSESSESEGESGEVSENEGENSDSDENFDKNDGFGTDRARKRKKAKHFQMTPTDIFWKNQGIPRLIQMSSEFEKFKRRNFSKEPLFPQWSAPAEKDFKIVPNNLVDNADDKGSHHVNIQCGLVIESVTWLPLGKETPVLALLCKPKNEPFMKMSDKEPRETIIQLWEISRDSEKKSFHARHMFSVLRPDGPICAMKFCPSGGNSADRLALMALTSVTGDVNIVAIPREQEKFTGKGLKLPSSLILKSTVNSVGTAVEWIPQKGHGLVIGGCINGMIILWKLEATSRLLKQNDREFLPLRIFRPFNAPVSRLSCNQNHFLATAGTNLKVFDMECNEAWGIMPSSIDLLYAKWIPNSPFMLVSYFKNRVSQGLYAVIPFTISMEHTKLIKAKSITCADYSPYLNAFIGGGEDGEVSFGRMDHSMSWVSFDFLPRTLSTISNGVVSEKREKKKILEKDQESVKYMEFHPSGEYQKWYVVAYEKGLVRVNCLKNL